MPELIIKYKSAKALKALQDLAKVFDMVIETPPAKNEPGTTDLYPNLPISFSKHPDVTALAGIWKDREITLEELRKEAWGDRACV